MNKEDLRITTFQDDKGYVFISYSSEDEETVFNDFIIPLQEKYGLQIFCDKNFKNRANQEWTSQMSDNISEAQACLLFISKTYAASYACLLEVLSATNRKIPFLKIQLEEPEVTKNYNVRPISDSTCREFRKIGEQLKNKGFGDARNSYLDLQDHIDKGQISQYTVSKIFCEFLGKISVTKLNRKDGLEAIKASLEQIQKERKGSSVFEDLTPAPEYTGKIESPSAKEKTAAVSETADTTPAVSFVRQESAAASAPGQLSGNLLFWKRFMDYLGADLTIPGTTYKLVDKLPVTHDSWISLKGVKVVRAEYTIRKTDRTLRTAVIIEPAKHAVFEKLLQYEDEINNKAGQLKKVEAVEWDKPKGTRIKFMTSMSAQDEKEDFDFLIATTQFIQNVIMPYIAGSSG